MADRRETQLVLTTQTTRGTEAEHQTVKIKQEVHGRKISSTFLTECLEIV